MKLKILIPLTLVVLAAVLLSGCAATPRDSIPASVISANINGKPASCVLPKDVEFSSLEFRAETNGTVLLDIKNLKARTNPDVVSMSGESYAKAIAAQGQALKDIITAAGTATGQAAGAIIKTP
jgi:hypothetical protein